MSDPLVGMPEDKVIPITDTLAFHPQASALKEIWDEGKVAIIQGIGYENSSRSHFRAMDIWHTCEPETIATEGWLAKVIREMDPDGENPGNGSQLWSRIAASLGRSERYSHLNR